MNKPEILLARSIWLFNTSELNERGVALGPIYRAIQERYRFLRYPHKPEDFMQSSVTFADGEFDGLSAGLQIYADGLLGDSKSSTTVSDRFLGDLLSWTAQEFRLNYTQDLVKTKAYESQIVFSSELSVRKKLKKLDQFARILEGLSSKDPAQQDAVAVMFRGDQLGRHSFTFERRDGIPFSENRYYSKAAVPTEKHLELIETFEQIIGS